MTTCKLFAAKLLDVPWLLHLDVFRPQINPVLTGRSRPDLVGQSTTGQWVAIESKGRVSVPDATTKAKAKDQALRCVSIGGTPVGLHIGAIAYFKNDRLRFHWQDPDYDGKERNTFGLPFDETFFRYHFAPALEIVRSDPIQFRRMLEEPVLVPVTAVDLQVGIRPDVLRLLARDQWSEARSWCRENRESLRKAEARPDGITVVAGESWRKRGEFLM
jgi:hypothetical protein